MVDAGGKSDDPRGGICSTLAHFHKAFNGRNLRTSVSDGLQAV